MKALGKIFTALIFVFLYAPMAVMIFFSFNSSRSTYVFEGFSFKWYGEFLNSSITITALKNTLLLAVLSAIIATIFGTVAAIGIYNLKSKSLRNTIMGVTNIPMMNPDVVTGVSLMLLFVFIGRFLGLSSSLNFYTLLIAHITFNLPYVILNVLPKLRLVGTSLTEAAQDLGCTYSKAFTKVILPNIYSGIVSGFLMAFTLSLDDFVISYFTNGTGFQTLPLLIYSKTKKAVKPDIYALSTVIFVAVLLLLLLVNSIKAKSENKEKGKATPKASKVKNIILTVISAAVCIAIIIYSFVPTGHYGDFKEKLECEYTTDLAGTTLNVFNWGEYISDGTDDTLNVIEAFEDITGIEVNYDNFDSNETMYSKLKSGAVSYDIIIPSDYMIERLKNENMLQKLDFSQIPNYKYIDEKYKNLYFDEKNEYSVPYSVGMTGLIYNSKMVDEPIDSWSAMWDEKYEGQVLTFNNSRDAFSIAQFMLGQDVNSTDKKDWDAAADLLIKQNPILQARVMDEIFTKMPGNNAAIAPYYAGDFLTMYDSNEDLRFVYPKEGVNIFVDSICVPENAKNTGAAMMFINFLLEPEVALANAEYICYASPHTAVVNNDNYSLKGNEILYPKEYPKVQYYHDIDPEIRTYYEKLWEEVLVN
ncbi:MAG: extracellular solute-binding protein [Acutalibacteraceae bacterium]